MAAGLGARGVKSYLDSKDSKFPTCLAEQSLPFRRAERGTLILSLETANQQNLSIEPSLKS